MDDTFVLLKPDSNIDDVPNILNGFHSSIQFTYELEKDGSIPFLDVKVIRSQVEQKTKTGDYQSTPAFAFDTTIHRKETFTGLMINWHSFVPHSYKKAGVVSMIQRALTICSTYTLLANEFDQVRRICQLNNYPWSFVDTCIGIGLTKHRNKQSETKNSPVNGPAKRRMFVEIPFVGNKTETLKKQINRLTADIRPDLDLRFVARPPRSVHTYFQVKDPVPTHLKSDVVYAVKCADCGDTYVGKTERQCARRMFEHGAPKGIFDKQPDIEDDDDMMATTNDEEPRTRSRKRKINKVEEQQQPEPPLRRSSRIRNKTKEVVNAQTNQTSDRKIEQTTKVKGKKEKTDNDIVSSSTSALTDHANNTGHRIDWAQVRILWGDHNPRRLLVKESLVIQAHQPRLNRTTHSVPLLIYPEGLDRTSIPDPHR